MFHIEFSDFGGSPLTLAFPINHYIITGYADTVATLLPTLKFGRQTTKLKP